MRETTTTTTTTVRRDDALYTFTIEREQRLLYNPVYLVDTCSVEEGDVRYIILFSFSFQFFAAHKYRLVSLNTVCLVMAGHAFRGIYPWCRWSGEEEGKRKKEK